jgi:hypothetical protein
MVSPNLPANISYLADAWARALGPVVIRLVLARGTDREQTVIGQGTDRERRFPAAINGLAPLILRGAVLAYVHPPNDAGLC